MNKLNIGCGKKIKEGYNGLDIVNFGQKFVCNILDFNICEAYDEVYAEHFLEHFTQEELKKLFRIVWLSLNPNGIFEIIVPSKEKDKAWVLTHKTFFTEETFKAFDNPIFSYEFCGLAYGKTENIWKVKEVRTNSRKDIYCKLIKII